MTLILNDGNFQFCVDRKKEYDEILSKLFPVQSVDAARVISIHPSSERRYNSVRT